MERDVRLVSDHPTIVTGRSGWNVKQHPGAEFVNRAVLHRSRGATGDDQPYVLDIAAGRAHAGAHVNRPLPSRLISSATDGHPADVNDFEFSFFECSYFVGLFKPLQNYFKHQQTAISKAKKQTLEYFFATETWEQRTEN
jgi:hypothetical protein